MSFIRRHLYVEGYLTTAEGDDEFDMEPMKAAQSLLGHTGFVVESASHAADEEIKWGD